MATMRTFGETLSVNRLRQAERSGDVLLRRPLMEPSTSGEFCEHLNNNGIPIPVNPPQVETKFVPLNGNNNRFSDCTETYPAPPSQFCVKAVDEEKNTEQTLERRKQPEEGGDSDDTDIDEEFLTRHKVVLVPSKSQVLFYVSTSSHLKIQQTGSEMQVTDSTGFPLLDVWAEVVCCSSPVWVVEAYGRRVLVMSDGRGPGPFASAMPRSLAAVFGLRTAPAITSITDWNGEIIGYFVLGDPFLIKSATHNTIARCTRTDQCDTWVCLNESTNTEIATITGDDVKFAADIAFQLKLLVLAALARAIGPSRAPTNCFPFLRSS